MTVLAVYAAAASVYCAVSAKMVRHYNRQERTACLTMAAILAAMATLFWSLT